MQSHLGRSSLVLILLTFAACTPFREVYHFRAGRPGAANYYRVTIEGWTGLTSSQYSAGLYDAEAVDALFGELTGPGKRISVDSTNLKGHPVRGGTSSTTTTTPPVTVVAASGSTAAESLSGRSLEGKKFVFFLSSNNDFFINQIQTYVTAERMQNDVVSLLLRGDVEQLERARLQRKNSDARAQSIADTLTAQVAGLGTGDNATAKDVRAAALQILNDLAARAQEPPTASFTSIAEAETWVRQHSGAFRQAGGAR